MAASLVHVSLVQTFRVLMNGSSGIIVVLIDFSNNEDHLARQRTPPVERWTFIPMVSSSTELKFGGLEILVWTEYPRENIFCCSACYAEFAVISKQQNVDGTITIYVNPKRH